MKLCLVCRDVEAHAASGLVTATRDLAEALADEGNVVHLLTDRSRNPALLRSALLEPLTVPVASGIFRKAAPTTARHNLLHAAAAYREVRRIHEREGPVDAVLAPLWRSEGALCLLDERFPTVVSCMTSLRTLSEDDPVFRQMPDLDERLALEGNALASCRYLHGLTRAVLSKTIEDYGLTPELTTVIGRGLRDLALASARDDGDRKGRPPELLFVGRIERRKGVDTLLDAAGELLDDGLAFNLRLVGPSLNRSFRLGLERAVAGRPRLAEAVQFIGLVSDAELARLYSASDIVCLPSRYESHGVALLEAMMFGKPIVTCDSGGIGEVVEAERNALLSPPDDASALARSLRRLLAEPELRAELGASARSTFEQRFDARATARQMQSFLEEVVAHHQATETRPGTIAQRLGRLLQDVLRVSAEEAARGAAELLDPADGETLRRLHLVARETRPRRPQKHPHTAAPRVAAVVLTHNRAELLERALNSLQDDDAPVETVVIDNGSTPTHARRIALLCAGRKHVRLRRSEPNLGTAGGRRLGLELTDRELLLFLDDDAELLPGALDHLLAELDSNPSAGAVTATVVSSDGTVSHSGGRLEPGNGVVTFGLRGAGAEFGREQLAPSGLTGWAPRTAVLVRRELLEEFPLDPQMAAHYEDNEWCYRISLERPGSFRRCREALVFHRVAASVPQGGPAANAYRVELLASATRFYQRHGVLLGPWLVNTILPELRAQDGTCDLAAGKLLMELLAAKGSDWMLAALNAGELEGVLNAHRWRTELSGARAELERLRQAAVEQ